MKRIVKRRVLKQKAGGSPPSAAAPTATRAAAPVARKAAAPAVVAAAVEEPDVFDMLDQFDLIDKLPGDFVIFYFHHGYFADDFYTQLDEKKWSLRKEALDRANELIDANPRLSTKADYGEIVSRLKVIIGKVRLFFNIR